MVGLAANRVGWTGLQRVSLMPHRVLALYGTRRRLGRLAIQPRFSRDLAVVVRKNRVQPEPLAAFVQNILF